jgi:hypothetical protein
MLLIQLLSMIFVGGGYCTKTLYICFPEFMLSFKSNKILYIHVRAWHTHVALLINIWTCIRNPDRDLFKFMVGLIKIVRNIFWTH